MLPHEYKSELLKNMKDRQVPMNQSMMANYITKHIEKRKGTMDLRSYINDDDEPENKIDYKTNKSSARETAQNEHLRKQLQKARQERKALLQEFDRMHNIIPREEVNNYIEEMREEIAAVEKEHQKKLDALKKEYEQKEKEIFTKKMQLEQDERRINKRIQELDDHYESSMREMARLEGLLEKRRQAVNSEMGEIKVNRRNIDV